MTQTRTPNMTDYEAVCQSFHLDVLEAFNFATDVIGTWASDPDKLAMLWVGQHGEERRITFAHFAERSSRAANAFTALGMHKGDRVLVMLPRIPEWWEAVLGLMKMGAIPIPCTTLLTPKDIQFRADIAESLAIVTTTRALSNSTRWQPPALPSSTPLWPMRPAQTLPGAKAGSTSNIS